MIELNFFYMDVWICKGIILYNDKEYYEVEVCLNEVVCFSFVLFKVIYNWGKNRLVLDNIEGVLGDFDWVVFLKLEYLKVYEYFGDVLMRIGKEEEVVL